MRIRRWEVVVLHHTETRGDRELAGVPFFFLFASSATAYAQRHVDALKRYLPPAVRFSVSVRNVKTTESRVIYSGR